MKSITYVGARIRDRGRAWAAGVLVLWAVPAAWAAPAGDTEPNQVVDLRDLLAIRNHFGQSGAPGFVGADLNDDGVVDNADLLIWRQNFPYVGSTLDAPYVAVYYPANGALLGERRPTVLIDYSPTSLTLNVSSLQVIVDGVDRTAEVIAFDRNAVLPIEQPLANGPHYVEASIEDIQGTVGTARSDFQLTSLTLRPRAVPQTGPAPLAVRFFPDVVWADNPPSQYLWDWNNDGTWDNGCVGCMDTSARPDPLTYTFPQEGLQTVKFGLYQGATSTLTTTTIQVAVTESFTTVSPSNGTAPLSVFLHGIAADLSDPITLYEWDYDYNGTFSPDYTSTSNPNTARVYVTAGVYHPVFRATHQSSAVVEYPVVGGELRVNAPGKPTAVAAGAQGADALTVNFSGTGTDNGTIVLYEWDFENDGTWDYSSPTSGDVIHTYPTAGTKVAALQVTDNDGNTSVDRVRVETFASATLEVLDDTVVPSVGEQTTIRTTTTIQSTVWLYIKSADGRHIRTLVDPVVRPAGTYDDLWEGEDFRYEPCHPGAYFAVLEYTYPGRTDVLDLADTTGGTQYFATRTSPNPPSFDPLADEFWVMSFIIPSASRASLYILPGGSNRTDTPFDNLPLGTGSYTYYWAGLSSQGQLAPSVAHLWSVNAWTLSDNAIVVQDLPEITSLDINPNLYSPTDRVPLDPEVTIDFTLSNASVVLAKVIRMDNGVTLRSFQTGSLSPGPQTILWDGRATNEERLSPGDYRFSIFAVDDRGSFSLEREAVLRVRY